MKSLMIFFFVCFFSSRMKGQVCDHSSPSLCDNSMLAWTVCRQDSTIQQQIIPMTFGADSLSTSQNDRSIRQLCICKPSASSQRHSNLKLLYSTSNALWLWGWYLHRRLQRFSKGGCHNLQCRKLSWRCGGHLLRCLRQELLDEGAIVCDGTC